MHAAKKVEAALQIEINDQLVYSDVYKNYWIFLQKTKHITITVSTNIIIVIILHC